MIVSVSGLSDGLPLDPSMLAVKRIRSSGVAIHPPWESILAMFKS